MCENICSSGIFTCPKCGSHAWGTSACTLSTDKWIGHCHGTGCDFSWHRESKDRDVFVKEPMTVTREAVLSQKIAVIRMQLETVQRTIQHVIKEYCHEGT